jgi:malate dehydrogenase (oxaloacetate-decarboxylating)(NADP+)
MISFSNFGSNRHPSAVKVRQAVEILHRSAPDLEADGEMQADTAVVGDLLAEFSWSRLTGPANVLVFPELQSANAAYKLIWRLADCEAVGPVLLGMSRPVHVLQRGVEVADIVNMAALCVVDAQEHPEKPPVRRPADAVQSSVDSPSETGARVATEAGPDTHDRRRSVV